MEVLLPKLLCEAVGLLLPAEELVVVGVDVLGEDEPELRVLGATARGVDVLDRLVGGRALLDQACRTEKSMSSFTA